ncbi:hypothetical protein L1279_003941, partial [Planomicrobium sp. HSC-17F08]|nr:hypothetical protein [Planomicrobium sp. HSC-17F08]
SPCESRTLLGQVKKAVAGISGGGFFVFSFFISTGCSMPIKLLKTGHSGIMDVIQIEDVRMEIYDAPQTFN